MSEFINTIDVLGDDAVIDSIIDRSITEFKDNVITKVGNYAFYGCTELTTVDIPNVTSIDMYAFYNCSSLSSINAPSLTNLGTYVFTSTALTTAIFPNIAEVGNQTFRSCKSLTLADFTALMKVNAAAFDGDSVLETLIIRNPNVVATLVNTNAFISTPIARGTGYVYVPRALVDSYKATSNWSTYAAQFRALEDYTVDGTTTGALDETKI